MIADEEIHIKGTGKWRLPNVPHKGWECDFVEDLGSPLAICEMCEEQVIRYVHHMRHPDYDGELACGCICAGHMEESLVWARRRERQLKNRLTRRSKWACRKWRVSAAGNPYLNSGEFNVVVYPRQQGQSWRVSHRVTGRTYFSPHVYASEVAAKVAIFDAINPQTIKQEQTS
jgi:hypothetical protein